MKEYKKPIWAVEEFVDNEHVSACYTLICTLPGRNPVTEDGTVLTYVEYWSNSRGEKYYRDGVIYYGNTRSGQGYSMGPEHGGYALGTNVIVDGGAAYEVFNPSLAVTNISIQEGTGRATWTSVGSYNHDGKYVLSENPNHS